MFTGSKDYSYLTVFVDMLLKIIEAISNLFAKMKGNTDETAAAAEATTAAGEEG